MKHFSQTFVNYHNCGNGYLDGTNKIVLGGRKCIITIYDPFWKKTIDASNKIANQQDHKLKINQKQTEVTWKDMQNI